MQTVPEQKSLDELVQDYFDFKAEPYIHPEPQWIFLYKGNPWNIRGQSWDTERNAKGALTWFYKDMRWWHGHRIYETQTEHREAWNKFVKENIKIVLLDDFLKEHNITSLKEWVNK